MESLPKSFTITVDGQKVAPPVENGDDQIHATTGNDAAVFTLNDGHLHSNGWLLGRYVVEDRSLLPKRVCWFRAGQDNVIQPVHTKEEEGSVVLKFGDAPLVLIDGLLFATLLDEPKQKVEINYQ